MSLVSDTELMRARWRRHLDVLALDKGTRSDFASAGLAGRVDRLVSRLILLPSDPDCERWEFDDAFWKQLEGHRSVNVGEGEIRLGDEVVATAHAGAIIRTHGYGMPWQRYAAVHRNGAIEVGLGDRRYRHQTRDDADEPVYVDLGEIVAFTWALGEVARMLGISETAGSCLLVVALPNTHGALLAGLGEGYHSPARDHYEPLKCNEKNLLWNVELGAAPANTSESQALAFRVGSRIENAWGLRQQIYLDHSGRYEGQFNSRHFNRRLGSCRGHLTDERP